MFEATVDAIFAEVSDLVSMEMDATISPSRSWRRDVINAFASQMKRDPDIACSSTDAAHWNRVITQVADAILGVRLYQQAEGFRDRDIQLTTRFLQQKGLPKDFLEQIPPLKSANQTQVMVDRIERLVF